MTDDVRCCGTGTCIINADGVCWCGQRWDGEKMSFSRADAPAATGTSVSDAPSLSAATHPDIPSK
ncbi:hypothetical protein MCEMAEM4_01694 [Burkholderiaceae bacterium]